MEEGEEGFVTGVGLFEKETPVIEHDELDEDMMLRDVTEQKYSDLEELRRMIKKTENNLRMYSHSVEHL